VYIKISGKFFIKQLLSGLWTYGKNGLKVCWKLSFMLWKYLCFCTVWCRFFVLHQYCGLYCVLFVL